MNALIRSFAAILAGFLTMVIIVVLGTALATALFVPGGMASMTQGTTPLPASYLTANLAVSLLAAVLGGWVAARLDAPGGQRAVFGLAVLVLAMSFANRAIPQTSAGTALTWYPWTLLVLGVTGALAGGWIRRRSQTPARPEDGSG